MRVFWHRPPAAPDPHWRLPNWAEEECLTFARADEPLGPWLEAELAAGRLVEIAPRR